MDREIRDKLLSIGLNDPQIADYVVDHCPNLLAVRLVNKLSDEDRCKVYEYAQPYAGVILEPPRENITVWQYVLKAIKNYARVMLIDDDGAWKVPDEDQQNALNSSAVFPQVEGRCGDVPCTRKERLRRKEEAQL